MLVTAVIISTYSHGKLVLKCRSISKDQLFFFFFNGDGTLAD